MENFKNKLLSFPLRLVDWGTRVYWIKCQIPKTSVAMGFTTIDRLSSIGKYTFINRFCEITYAKIGNYCSIGSGVRIGSGEHDFRLMTTSSFVTGKLAKDLTKEPCLVGHDVWIGTQAFVKRGVTVGDGAVVGAHSTVTRDVPSFAIVVGSPAKVIKYRFPKEVRSEILASNWWNSDLQQAKEYYKKYFTEKEDCNS